MIIIMWIQSDCKSLTSFRGAAVSSLCFASLVCSARVCFRAAGLSSPSPPLHLALSCSCASLFPRCSVSARHCSPLVCICRPPHSALPSSPYRPLPAASMSGEEDASREIFGYTSHLPVPVWQDAKAYSACHHCNTKFSSIKESSKQHRTTTQH